MNSSFNIKSEQQDCVSIGNTQTLNRVRTINSQNAIRLMTGGTDEQVMQLLPAALQQTKITGPNVKLNPVAFGSSGRESNTGNNTNNIPVKFIIAPKGVLQTQPSAEKSHTVDRFQEINHSFVLTSAASKSSFAMSSAPVAISTSSQNSFEHDISKRFAMITVPSSSKSQEIGANGFTLVTAPSNVLQIGEPSVQTTAPIKISVKPLISPSSIFPQQFNPKVMFTTAQPAYSGPQTVLRTGSQLKVVPSSTTQLQLLSSDGKFQYVKLVAPPNERSLITADTTAEPLKLLIPSLKPLPPKVASAVPSSIQDKKRPLQRMILPATFRLKSQNEDDLTVASSHPLSADSSRVTTPVGSLSMTQAGNSQLSLKSVKLEPEATSSQGSNYSKVSNAVDSAQKLRRPCNCSKSNCLKLYCECFATGEFCNGCNCNHCLNNLENENHRQRAIRSCLNRNPQAFHPKIGKSREGEVGRQHSKGCHCKRSGCLKNYCECYEAKIPCTEVCRCHGCKNYETGSGHKSLMHLASAAEVRVQQQLAATTVLDSHLEDLPRKSNLEYETRSMPHAFITLHVVDTIGECLLEIAEKWEEEAAQQWEEHSDPNDSDADIIKLLLEEFGRCASRLITVAGTSDR